VPDPTHARGTSGRRLPRPLRLAAARLADSAMPRLSRVLRFVPALRPPAWRLAASHGGEPVSLIFAGREPEAHDFAARLGQTDAFPAPFGRAALDWLRGPLPEAGGDPDLLIFQLDRALAWRARRAGAFVIPEWVTSKLDLPPSGPVESALPLAGNTSLKADLRAVRLAGFRRADTREPAALDAFYHNHYLPGLVASQGGAAIPSKLSWLHRQLDRGELVQAVRNGGVVGGLLLVRSGRTALPLVAGYGLGPDGRPAAGLCPALYLFAMDWAREHGCTLVDFGPSRAFLNDGILRYKRKWGMRAEPCTWSHRFHAVQVRRLGPAAWRWLEQNPFITQQGRLLTGELFDPSPVPLDTIRLQRLIRGLALPGLDHYRLHSPAGAAPGAAETASQALGVRVLATPLAR